MLGRTGKQFLRYYILFFVCLIFLFIPFYYVSHSLISNNYVETAGNLLNTGLTNLENDLTVMEEISFTVYNSPRFRFLSFKEPLLNTAEYFQTIYIADDFRRYFATSGMIEDCGIIFNNNIVLTTKRLYFSTADFYGQFFRQSDIPEFQQWIDRLAKHEKDHFTSAYLVPLASFVTRESSYEAITYVQMYSSYPNHTSFFFATLKKDYILSRLATDEVLHEGHVAVYDPAGFILFESGHENTENDKGIVTISMTGKRRGIHVNVDIPRRVFSKKMIPFVRIAVIFAIIYIITGIVLSIIFAQRSAIPVRKIMDKMLEFRNRDGEDPEKYKNDFNYMEHFITRAKWDYEVFENKLKQQGELQRDNLFERLLYSFVCSRETYESVNNFLPDFPKKFRLAAIAMPVTEEVTFQTVRQTMVREIIEPKIPQGGYVHFSGNTLVLFLPDNEEYSGPGGSVGSGGRLGEMVSDLRIRMNTSVKTALSETVLDIREIHSAFYRVQQLLRLPYNTQENEILQTEKTTQFSFPVEFLDVTRLYEFIMHADNEKSAAMIKNIYSELCKRENINENDIQQIFFLYRRVIIQVINDLNLNIEKETIIPAYDSHRDIDYLFGNITDSIQKICDKIKSRHDEQNIEFEKSVIQYVDENITNPDLYSRLVTDHFNIMEIRLHNIFRRCTGKSFHEYVESKRMALSREMLIKTTLSIPQISRNCGYSSDNSFYKAFRRFYKMSPSNVRG